MKVNFSAQMASTNLLTQAKLHNKKDIQQHTNVVSQPVNTSKSNNTKKYLAYAVGVGALIFAGYKLIKGKKQPTPQTIETAVENGIETLKSAYNSIVERFPKDKAYYTKLAQGIGLQKGEEYKLTSIVGEEQLTHLLKNEFKPVDFKLGTNFEGLKAGTYRVNLHNHTTASDGKLSVKDFLEQAAKWADKVKSKLGVNDNKPPFTIAITDHDTTAGLKEALKVISQDPEKFKNLRVVLGAEISVSHIKPKDIKKPFNFELIGYGLNPFNEKLNGLLSKTTANRVNLAQSVIQEINEKCPTLNLNWEEAKRFHPNISRGTSNGAIWLIEEYAKFKMCLQKILADMKECYSEYGDVNFDIGKLLDKYSKDYYYKMDTGLGGIKRGDVFQYFYNRKTIEMYPIPNFHERDLSPIDLNSIKDIRTKYTSNPECMLDKGIVITPKMLFDATKQGGNEGFFGIAHPGFFNLSDCEWSDELLKHCQQTSSDTGLHFIWTLVKSMKDDGGKLFGAMEKNYQSYGNDLGKKQWGDKIFEIAKNGGIVSLEAGGLDCHRTIFTKHEMLDKNLVESLGLEDIIGVTKC